MFIVKFFLGVGYMPLGAPSDCIIAIVNPYDAAQSFIVTIYPPL